MTSPHDRPDPLELLAAVRQFLQDDVILAVTGQVAFHTRVAINLLNVIERELTQSSTHVEVHRRRLAQLGMRNDADLAAAIRAGNFGDRVGEVTRLVRGAVRDKLAVVNPKYRLPYTAPETAREQ